jgi:hypothetical protein
VKLRLENNYLLKTFDKEYIAIPNGIPEIHKLIIKLFVSGYLK